MFVSWFLVPWCDNPRVNMRMCDIATVSLNGYKQGVLCIELKQNDCLTVLIKALIYAHDETRTYMGGIRFSHKQAREQQYNSCVFLYRYNKHMNNAGVSRSHPKSL